ncbi:Rcs stress response system protein RcsF, partial [Salmonella enterica subsp. enterica serovar Kentucky]|nr:Rcs stress response system protein RcsF [Salmonella enterica subsp. enterica serovar Kentucky]
KAEPEKPKAPRAAPVRIYTNAEDLVGKPFRDLGEVSGESCQARLGDGVIADYDDDDIAQLLADVDVPIVGVGGSYHLAENYPAV